MNLFDVIAGRLATEDKTPRGNGKSTRKERNSSRRTPKKVKKITSMRKDTSSMRKDTSSTEKDNTSSGSRKKTAWKDEFYLKSYLLAKEGRKDNQIARILGVSHILFKAWLRSKKALRGALEEARSTQDTVKDFLDYVYGQLPENLKEIWDEIDLCESGVNFQERLEGLSIRGGKRARQLLFLHALVHCDFNPSEACKKVGISYHTINLWKKETEFGEILEQFHEHKKNFFEGQLIKLVRTGDSSATIFANRTVNKDRGYGEKIAGTGHTINYVNVEELNLPLEVRVAILEAVKRKDTPQLELKQVQPVQDAEFEIKETSNG